MQPKSYNQNGISSPAKGFIVYFYLSIVLIVGIAYLGRKVLNSPPWIHDAYYAAIGLALLNVLYFGWVRRAVIFGRSGRTVTGGMAVVASVIYIAVILAAGGIAWSNMKPSENHTSGITTHR